MKHASQPSRYIPPAIDPAHIAVLVDRALAGDVVQPASIEELCALLDEAKRRGYELKHRTSWEQREAPWLLLLVPITPLVVSAETKEIE